MSCILRLLIGAPILISMTLLIWVMLFGSLVACSAAGYRQGVVDALDGLRDIQANEHLRETAINLWYGY